MDRSYKEIMNDIKTFVFDIDGVLTDGTVHIAPNGDMLREMHNRDGFAMKAALESGYNVCIISGGSNEGVRIRLRNLGITDIYMASANKVETFKEYADLYKIEAETVLCSFQKNKRKDTPSTSVESLSSIETTKSVN